MIDPDIKRKNKDDLHEEELLARWEMIGVAKLPDSWTDVEGWKRRERARENGRPVPLVDVHMPGIDGYPRIGEHNHRHWFFPLADIEQWERDRLKEAETAVELLRALIAEHHAKTEGGE